MTSSSNRIRPTRSFGEISRRKTASPSLASSSFDSSPIDPETSTTSITFAGFRSSRHAVLDPREHARLRQREDAGGLRRVGAVGRVHRRFRLLVRIAGPEAGPSCEVGRRPRRSASHRRRRRHPSLSSRPTARRGRCRGCPEEGALLGIDPHELGRVAPARVEVDQRDLLHRHRGGISGPVLLELSAKNRSCPRSARSTARCRGSVGEPRASRRPPRSVPRAFPPLRSTRRRHPTSHSSRSPGSCARA